MDMGLGGGVDEKGGGGKGTTTPRADWAPVSLGLNSMISYMAYKTYRNHRSAPLVAIRAS